MSVHINTADAGVKNPTFKLPIVPGVLFDMDDKIHMRLLEYLQSRLIAGEAGRPQRLRRYMRVDKFISTWQRLAKEDAEREDQEDNTGKSQAIPMNLPILAAHLEDFVSFYAEVFSPRGRDYYVIPPRDQAEPAKALAKKMNRDTRARKYYKELCAALRALVKYNIGGLAARFEVGSGQGELAEPGNRVESIDMYNYLYDPAIKDPSRIPTEAEWAARVTEKNHKWLIQQVLRGRLQRVHLILDEEAKSNTRQRSARFYREPPVQAQLGDDGRDARGGKESQVDWSAYGASLSGDSMPDIHGYETIEMYCWLNPWEFNLIPKSNPAGGEEGESSGDQGGIDLNGESYQLWRFIIIANRQVVLAEPVQSLPNVDPEIPHYVCFLTQDDMKGAQRSQMEYLRPFQRFASFLYNIRIAGARKNIWGLKGYDPSMFDMSGVEKGDVAGTLPSKQPGRDVRTGLTTLDSSTGTNETSQMFQENIEVMRLLFPSQSLPSQIAGIDRAVKNQVAAVLQGVTRRLHMSAKLLDNDLFMPLRLQQYRNLAVFDNEGLDGLTEEIVAKVLGSGLNMLDREVILQELRELMFAIMQNQMAMQKFDLASLMTYMSQLMNSPSDLGEFVIQEEAQAPDGSPTPPAGAPIAGGV